MKQIRDKTGVRVDIPRKDGLAPGLSTPGLSGISNNGRSNVGTPSISGTATPLIVEEDEQEPTIQITIVGPEPMAEEARLIILGIIGNVQTTRHIRDIPAHIMPFILPHRATFEAAAGGEYITTTSNAAAREITVSGEREAVIRVIEAIKSGVESFTTGLQSVSFNVPKRQHRLLTGKAADDIMAQNKCVVIVPKAEDPTVEVFVWGKPEDLGAGLLAVMNQSNSVHVHEFPLPANGKQILTYMSRVNFTETLTASHPDLTVYTPEPTLWDKSASLNIELAGAKPIVDAAIKKLTEFIGKLNGALKDVTLDWIVQRIVAHKNAKT